ncbi:LOW QUALITY PROTEIN: hypothetical protein V2J09_010547, partial [Rumex salicifolius]
CQADTIHARLDRFCEAFGECVSYAKSIVLFGGSTPKRIREAICGKLGIVETTDFERYLGIPVGAGRMSKGKYSFLLDKFEKKLQGWMTHTLSLIGRVTLARAVLTSLLLFYVMQTSLLPCGVCDSIDKTVCRYIWGATGNEQKISLLAWDKDSNNGGLNIRPMRETNQVTLAKRGWRFLNEPNALWAKVLLGKYCSNRNDIDMIHNTDKASFSWRGIVHVVDLRTKGVSMVVGKGTRTLFWLHRWVDEEPLTTLSGT